MASEHQRRRCEFQLLRYVPDAVRNEFVHIGVILREQGEGGKLDVRFTRDWRRVRCLDPEADTALLEGMESELRRRLQEEASLGEALRAGTQVAGNEAAGAGQDGAQRAGAGPPGSGKGLMKVLEESLSLNVQMTGPKGYLAESLPAGMEELMRMYVEAPPREKVSRVRGRAAIQGAMRGEFERAGVWDLMRKQIRAAEYTRPGDPLRIDAGYRPNGIIRMFHAVSLEAGVEMAKVLAFSAAGLRSGVERVEKAELELTAFIEPAAKLGLMDEEPERLAMYRFGVETMEEHRIRVLTTTELAGVAATARREMNVE